MYRIGTKYSETLTSVLVLTFDNTTSCSCVEKCWTRGNDGDLVFYAPFNII